MLCLMAEVEKKKKWTFCKFTYRGVDLDQLLSMCYEQLMQLYSTGQRRRHNRGLRREQVLALFIFKELNFIRIYLQKYVPLSTKWLLK